MNLRQTPFFKKLFIIIHLLFYSGCQASSTHNNISHTTDEIDKVHIVKKKTLQYIPYIEKNWIILQQMAFYEDETKLNSIAAIWIIDDLYPMELITLESLTPKETSLASYSPGDKIHLRSSDEFYPVKEELNEEIGKNNLFSCNQNEFKMLARIHSNFTYTGVEQANTFFSKRPWFQFGNVICVEIERENSQ